MVSIIVCTINEAKFQTVEQSIKTTIGEIEFEIIKWDNRKHNYGLSEAYNICLSSTNFNHLCFVHDDLIFHTVGWGKKIITHLKDPKTGFIGVMGGRYKSANGLLWRDGSVDMYRFNIKDGVEAGRHLYFNPYGELKSEVLCLDGAFLCTKKEVLEKVTFDQDTFSGFHFYDADICLQTSRRYKNFVVYDILTEHFSQGNLNSDFITDSLKFDNKWNKILPASIDLLSPKEIEELEGYALSEKLRVMRRNNFSFSVRSHMIFRYLIRYKNFYHFLRSAYIGLLK